MNNPKHSIISRLFILLLVSLVGSSFAQETILINEFMAINASGLDDQDGDEEDWIELYNPQTTSVSLDGWYLTDDANDLTKWVIPPVTLAPEGYIVIFASGKDLRDPSQPLHTNFKLRSAGEYLGLIYTDGTTVVSEVAPQYPTQAPDVSFGIYLGHQNAIPLVHSSSPTKALIPTDSSMDSAIRPYNTPRWTQLSFNDDSWLEGTLGVGYDYDGFVGLDVRAMRTQNQTVYIHAPRLTLTTHKVSPPLPSPCGLKTA